MRFNPADELSNDDAHQLIREIVNSGTVIESKHAKKRMQERGYSTHDVTYILLHGKITAKEHNQKANNWAYTVRGDDLDGDEGGVVTAVINQSQSVIITVLA